MKVSENKTRACATCESDSSRNDDGCSSSNGVPSQNREFGPLTRWREIHRRWGVHLGKYTHYIVPFTTGLLERVHHHLVGALAVFD